MKLKHENIIYSLGITLMLTYGCVKTESSVSINGWDGKTPFGYQINSYLSTNWEGDNLTLFITNENKTVVFRSISGGEPNIEIPDCFICDSYKGSSVGLNDSFQKSIVLCPSHVGNTQLHISNLQYDEIMRIVILPEFYTFSEPSLDFDDTQDSVTRKLSSLHYTEAGGIYSIPDPHNDYSLTIDYSASGMVDSYEVSLGNTVDSEELTGFISERYFKTSAYYNGMPVFIKAFNIKSPSISDATFVVMLDIEGRKIKYQNPLTYSRQL